MIKPPVIIVVDDPVQATELSALVKKSGYTVAAACSRWEEAVKSEAANKPAIILLDLSIPGSPDGIATAALFQARQDSPVIFIAGSESEAKLAAAKHPGRFGYISKPLDEREIRIALELAHYRQNAEKKIRLAEDELKKYRAHLEAVIVQRTAELRKTNAQLQRLLHFIELTERKLATDSLEIDLHDEKEIPISIEEGVITADTDLNIVLINEAALHQLGWTEEDATGTGIGEVFACTDGSVAGRLVLSLKSLVLSGTAGERLGNISVQSRSGDAPVLVSYAEPIFDSDGKRVGVVLTFRNAAESRRKEYEALRTRKLESLNLMVRGAAHDFNNILSSVLANIQLARMELKESDSGYGRLNRAEDSLVRARELSDQLLTYSAGVTPQGKTTDLVRLIRDVGAFSVRGTRVNCEFAIPADLWSVPLDEDLVRLMLNDLFLFLDSSMADGGTIRVSTRNILAGTAEMRAARPGDYVRISLVAPKLVIPQEALEDIFKPGSSLAFALDLSVAESMIQKCGGVLDVRSGTEAGTEILLHLPAQHAPAGLKPVLKSAPPAKKADPSKKKILLMDDEEAILSATGEMLKFLGYEVVVAYHGDAAIEIFRNALSAGAPFDAAILDITIPGGMGARETMPRLVALDPLVKGIISSGYSTNPMIVDFRSFGYAAVIVKPYGFKELGEALDCAFK
ncbi:MAG: response regulator [Methanoregula sp.]|nr:response regulator [Methanoregula sp.]